MMVVMMMVAVVVMKKRARKRWREREGEKNETVWNKVSQPGSVSQVEEALVGWAGNYEYDDGDRQVVRVTHVASSIVLRPVLAKVRFNLSGFSHYLSG